MQELPADQIPDVRKTNKAGVAEWFGVTLPTVDNWLRKHMPFLQRGSKGVAWTFDLLAVAEWRVHDLMEMPPMPDQSDLDPEMLAPKDRLDFYKGSREKLKHMEEMGAVVPLGRYESVLATTIKGLAITLESLPDVLERDVGMRGEALTRVQEVVDSMRDDLANALCEHTAAGSLDIGGGPEVDDDV